MELGKEVLIITGACGVGKTTLAKEWAKSKQGAIIECDLLTEWIYKEDFPKWNEEEEKFTCNLAGLMAIEYLKAGMSVAIENVWTPKGIEFIRNEIFRVPGIKVTTVRLTCDIEENHKRDQQRKQEDQMKERVDIVNAELEGYKWPSYIKHIDTTSLELKDILLKIEEE